jgi:putative ABC transport system permease protein
MLSIALKMLLHNKLRSVATIAGISVAFFLSAAQIGLLVGWCSTTSAIIRHTKADVWVMAEQNPAFDYGTAIPRHRLYQVRSVPGVAAADAMTMGWTFWQRPDGRNINVELVGLDDDLVGAPWSMAVNDVTVVQQPDSVIIDALYQGPLGVSHVGEEVEMMGRRAVVRGISRGVRTFTAAPFVFTSLESAVKYDARYKHDEITYVLARCQAGVTPAQLRDAISSEVSAVQVLTQDEFALKTILYWMLETGVGITVITTAALGIIVATVIISLTLYAITNDHLPNYATLLAIGFRRMQLGAIVLIQAVILGSVGILLGSIAFGRVSEITEATPIPIQTTPIVFAMVFLALLGCCVGMP